MKNIHENTRGKIMIEYKKNEEQRNILRSSSKNATMYSNIDEYNSGKAKKTL